MTNDSHTISTELALGGYGVGIINKGEGLCVRSTHRTEALCVTNSKISENREKTTHRQEEQTRTSNDILQITINMIIKLKLNIYMKFSMSA